uniref:aspartate/glutamate racemase family protein n=1 Tax=Stappia sp. TaxID=1870903 RepID=UPI003BAC0006
MRVRGGAPVAGAAVGIAMLDTRFPRIPGDLGNALTWPFPVLYRVVRGARPELAVSGDTEQLLAPFIEAGRGLVADGAQGIVTSCGFLVRFQDRLRDALGVPVATSSLMQVPMVQALLPAGKRVGILTISAQSLGLGDLAAAGCAPDTPIAGTDGGREFSRVILANEEELDVDLARADLVAAGRELIARHPEVGAIVLECTNMVPYAADIRAACGVPVYSVASLVTWFQSGLDPARYPVS